MGVLTGTQLENEVRANLGNRTDLDGRLYRFLNFAQDQLARYHQFDELEEVKEDTFTSSVGSVSLPSKPLAIRSFRLIDGSNSRKLVYYSPRQFDLQLPKPDWYSTGRPSIYTKYSKTLEVWRVPDDSYTYKLRYKKYPTAFTDGSGSTSDFEGLDDVLICLATRWAFISLGESEKAKEWLYIAAREAKNAKGLDLYNPDFEVSDTSDVSSLAASGEYWKSPWVKGVR